MIGSVGIVPLKDVALVQKLFKGSISTQHIMTAKSTVGLNTISRKFTCHMVTKHDNIAWSTCRVLSTLTSAYCPVRSSTKDQLYN